MKLLSFAPGGARGVNCAMVPRNLFFILPSNYAQEGEKHLNCIRHVPLHMTIPILHSSSRPLQENNAQPVFV